MRKIIHFSSTGLLLFFTGVCAAFGTDSDPGTLPTDDMQAGWENMSFVMNPDQLLIRAERVTDPEEAGPAEDYYRLFASSRDSGTLRFDCGFGEKGRVSCDRLKIELKRIFLSQPRVQFTFRTFWNGCEFEPNQRTGRIHFTVTLSPDFPLDRSRQWSILGATEVKCD